jgi:hypothetical protein
MTNSIFLSYFVNQGMVCMGEEGVEIHAIAGQQH